MITQVSYEKRLQIQWTALMRKMYYELIDFIEAVST